jgi:hypothetical protein
LLAASGHNLLIPLTAGELEPSLDDLAALDVPAHLALHIRAMQRACNTGWQPDEARHKWLYMHAVAITEILRAEAYVANLHRLPSSTLRGLDRVLEIFIDTRIAYLAHGIESLGDRAGSAERHTDARAHLANAERRRKRASALARQLAAENTQLISDDEAVVAEIARTHPTGDAASRRSEAASLVERQAAGPRRTQRMLALLQEHCKEAFLALNEIQRAWMCIEDTAGMIEEMYAWLYDQYPPRFPSILRDLLTPGEAARLDAPLLA